MKFSFELSKLISNRQFNSGKSSILKYEKKIISSFYESSNQMYSLVRDFKKPSFKICFSEDGRFIAEDNSIWQFNDDYLFTGKSKIIEIENSARVFSIAFNKDSSKVLVSGQLKRHDIRENVFLYDLEKLVKTNLSPEKLALDITSNPIHYDLFCLSTYEKGLFLKDLREKSFEKLEDCENTISVKYHPKKDHTLLVCTKIKNEVYVYDTRNRKRVFEYKVFKPNGHYDIYATYNKEGNKIFLTKSYSSPLLYDVDQCYPIYQFDETSYSCYNSYFLSQKKNCCFAGQNDEFLVAPSEDYNVYIWQIPKNRKENINKKEIVPKINFAKYVLKNNSKTCSVAYNYKKSVLACSGKEETLKFWSFFPFNLKSDAKRDYSDLYYIYDEDLGFEHYPNSTIIEELHYSIYSFLISFPLNYNEACDKDHYDFKIENFKTVYTKNFLKEFKQDFNINYIKSFVNNYNAHVREKYFNYIDKLEETFEKEIDFEKRLFENDYLSLLFELNKVFYTKHFIIRSLKYIKQQLVKLDQTNEELFISETNEKTIKEVETVLNLSKIQLILKSLVIDLEIIVLENDKLFKNPIKLVNKLLKYYLNSNYLDLVNYSVNVYDNMKDYLDEKSLLEGYENFYRNKKNNETIAINEIKQKFDFKLFNSDLKESLENLRDNLEKKKKKNFCNKSIDNVVFTNF